MICEVSDTGLSFVRRLLARSGVMFWVRRRRIYRRTTDIFVCVANPRWSSWVEMDDCWYRFRLSPELGCLDLEKSRVRP